MLTSFRLVFLCATLLCLALAGLVTASLFLADRAPQGGQYVWITVSVSGIFIALGMLLFGIQRHVAGIVRWSRRGEPSIPSDIGTHILRLLLNLSRRNWPMRHPSGLDLRHPRKDRSGVRGLRVT
jgi:hypothetical protein